MHTQESIECLSLRVTPKSAPEVVALIESQLESRIPAIIAAHNLHSAYLYHTDREFNAFYDTADTILIDGWPILAALNYHRRRAGKMRLAKSYRVGSTDWIPRALALGAMSRVCVLGASRSSNEAFIAKYSELHPSIEFLGIPGHPWSNRILQSASGSLKEFQPQLTLVAMGMPLQESVVSDLRREGAAGIIATVGGAVDQLSGTQALAPRWTGALGIEWLYRLASDPRRLAHRYLVEPFKLASALRDRRTS